VSGSPALTARKARPSSARRLGQLGRLLRTDPDLVPQPVDAITAEDGSPKRYALDVVRQATAGHVERAADMLLASWQASPRHHAGVLYWLAEGGLEAEILAKAGPPPGTAEQAPDAGDLAQEVETPEQAPDATPATEGGGPAGCGAAATPCKRPCYDRDHLWLTWADDGLRPAGIRDRWNKEYQLHGGKPVRGKQVGAQVVKTGLKKARAERQAGTAGG
jgi:hypothetical protein